MKKNYEKKLIIFDFDGTIADSFEILISIINDLLEKEGREKFSEEAIEKSRDLSVKEIIANFKISKWKLLFFLRKAQKKFGKKILAVKPIAGIEEVIKYLKERGLTIGILSSSDSKIIKKFIRKNNLDVFDFIRSKRNLFGKAPEIKKILKMYNLSPGQAFYVGDEVRDIEAAKVAGVFSVAVNWGFNSKKALQKADPDYFIDAVSDLKKILNQLDF